MLSEQGIPLSRQGVVVAFMGIPLFAAFYAFVLAMGWASPAQAVLYLAGGLIGISIGGLVNWRSMGRILLGDRRALHIDSDRLIYTPPFGKGFNAPIGDILSARAIGSRGLQVTIRNRKTEVIPVGYLATDLNSLQSQISAACRRDHPPA